MGRMARLVESLVRMILLHGPASVRGYRRTHHSSISRLVVTTLYIKYLLSINL